MRHDPDIVLIGEMRELETMKLALSCASMGMLVFGTLHTNNAPKTVDRIINSFPADDQNQVRVMLSGCLAGIVAQLLCPRIPKGRCAVHEILLQHEALGNTVRSGQIANIRAIIEGSGAGGDGPHGHEPHEPGQGRHDRAEGGLHEGREQGGCSRRS